MVWTLNSQNIRTNTSEIHSYTRVSTQDQELVLQLDALVQVGCEKIYQEKVSGATKARPQLEALLEHLRNEDIVIVWKLDRLARSLKDLVSLVNQIQEKGASFQSINDQIDTTSAYIAFKECSYTETGDMRSIKRERNGSNRSTIVLHVIMK